MLNENQRKQLLESINVELGERGLKPIPKIGDITKGEMEIVQLVRFIGGAEKHFVDVLFEMQRPHDGRCSDYVVRFNANGAVSDGAVFVPVINGRFAIVKQWRVPLGRWSYEVPRGWCEDSDLFRVLSDMGGVSLSDVPLSLLERELGKRLVDGAKLTSVAHLGDIAQNTGTDTATPSYFLVGLEAPEETLHGKLKDGGGVGQVKLWDEDTVRAEFGRKLSDSHSITALALAFNHVDRQVLPARRGRHV